MEVVSLNLNNGFTLVSTFFLEDFRIDEFWDSIRGTTLPACTCRESSSTAIVMVFVEAEPKGGMVNNLFFQMF